MKKKYNILLSLALILGAATITAHGQYTVNSTPVGAVELVSAAGSGQTLTPSLISPPLWRPALQTGRMSGVISSFNKTSIQSTGANWQPSSLTAPDKPHALMITSGSASGAVLLLSADAQNSSESIAVRDPHNRTLDVSTLGVVAGVDTFRIFELDTILSLFGTPDPQNPSAIRGGTSHQSADRLTVAFDGSLTSYYFNTLRNQWVQIKLGNPSGDHTPILPYYGIQFGRLHTESFRATVLGEVPTIRKRLHVRNRGATIMASYWPVTQTLEQIGLHQSAQWVSGENSNADRVVLTPNGSAQSFFHDGANWRQIRLGSPIANETTILPGQAAMLMRNQQTGGTILEQDPPYNL